MASHGLLVSKMARPEQGDKFSLVDNRDLPPAWLLSVGMQGRVIKQFKHEGFVVNYCEFKNHSVKFRDSELIPLEGSRLEKI